jgi:hypothetical protein
MQISWEEKNRKTSLNSILNLTNQRKYDWLELARDWLSCTLQNVLEYGLCHPLPGDVDQLGCLAATARVFSQR